MKARVLSYDLNKLLSDSRGFISKRDDRPLLNKIALYFNKEKQNVTAVATDLYRMSIKSISCMEVDEDFYVIVPSKLPFDDDEGDIIISREAEKIKFESFSCNKIVYEEEGELVDYKKVMPNSDSKFRVAFNPILLGDTLKKCKNNKSVVILEFDLNNNDSAVVIKVTENDIKLVLPCHLDLVDKNFKNF